MAPSEVSMLRIESPGDRRRAPTHNFYRGGPAIESWGGGSNIFPLETTTCNYISCFPPRYIVPVGADRALYLSSGTRIPYECTPPLRIVGLVVGPYYSMVGEIVVGASPMLEKKHGAVAPGHPEAASVQ